MQQAHKSTSTGIESQGEAPWRRWTAKTGGVMVSMRGQKAFLGVWNNMPKTESEKHQEESAETLLVKGIEGGTVRWAASKESLQSSLDRLNYLVRNMELWEGFYCTKVKFIMIFSYMFTMYFGLIHPPITLYCPSLFFHQFPHQ
jgi:hypothetical protein